MTQAILLAGYLQGALRSFLSDERAQDAFEYVLVIGGVTVAVILAVATPIGDTLIDAVVGGTCTAINGIPGITVTCT